MRRRAGVGAFGYVLALWAATAGGQAMPSSIAGIWRIEKILPTSNVTCWGTDRARTLLGTKLTYEPGKMIWKGGPVPVAEVFSRRVSSASYLQVDRVRFAELGIHTPDTVEFDLQHEDADITGATTEVPGDTILLAGPNRIVVSACGVYFSALRVGH